MLTTFSKISVFAMASHTILFKFLSVYFLPGSKFGMIPQKRINFHFIKNKIKIVFCLVHFQNKLVEIQI